MKRTVIVLATCTLLTACRDFLTAPATEHVAAPALLLDGNGGSGALPLLLATTNRGELIEIDLNAGTSRWIGDAGHTNGLEHGWNGLSFDDEGTLFVTSRHFQAEPETDGCTGVVNTGSCNHLYTVNPDDGHVLRHIGSTGVAFMADIDFGPMGVLFASLFFNDVSGEHAGLATVDTSTASATKIGLFGPTAAGRNLDQGGLSVHPTTGAIWAIEGSFAIDNGGPPHIFAVDPATGAVDGTPVPLQMSDGTAPPFGFDALEILPGGQFIGLRARFDAPLEVYSIDPVTGMISHIPVTADPQIVGKANGLEHIPPSDFPFASFEIPRATFAFDPQGRVGRDQFEIDGALALNEASDGIDLLADPVTLRVGRFREELPPGSFVRNATDDGFAYDGAAPGITRFTFADDGTFSVEADELDLAELDLGPTPVELGIGNDFGVRDVSFDRIGSAPIHRRFMLLATTNAGELVEIDLDAGTRRLLGSAGPFEGRQPEWTGLTYDDRGRLVATSRWRSELPGQGCDPADSWYNTDGGRCSHLYEIDPSTGAIVQDLGSTGFAFLSDIDLTGGGALLASVYLNKQASGDGGLITLDPQSGAGTLVSRFGPADLGRDLENGALAAHPNTGDIWAIESSNASNYGTPSIFRIDPTTGLAMAPAVPLRSGGAAADFGFDGLEILPDGRFVGTRAGGAGELYTIDQRSGAVTRVPLSAGGPQAGHLNGLTLADPTIPFDQFRVTLAWIKVTNRYESRDRVRVWGRFHAPDGIDPVTEAVTIGFGGDEGFNLTIPPGAFERLGRRKHSWWWSRGKWEYRAPHGTSGIRKMQIWDDGRFWISAERLDLGGVNLQEPVDFTIWLGNNTGGFAIPFNHRGFFFNHH